MAANSSNSIRVRLYFDYPPPAVTNCRMCLMLVDLNKCRVVADLASLIREKFCFSRKNIFSLFVADCYLPHAESVNVVRDNDAIRVKVDNLTQVNGFDECSFHSDASGKRRRDTEEDPTENVVGVKCKKKKRKKKNPEHHEEELTQASNGGANMDKLKTTKKAKKVQHNGQRTESTNSIKSSTIVAKPVKTTTNTFTPTAGTKRQAASSIDSSDVSSEEDDVVKKSTPHKIPPKTTPLKPALIKKVKATPTKPCPAPPLSSSKIETSNKASSEAPTETQLKKKASAQDASSTKGGTTFRSTTRVQPNLLSDQSKNSVHKQTATGSDQHVKKVGEKESSESCSSSEEEIKLVIKRPIQATDKRPSPGTRDSVWNLQGRGRGGNGGREGGRTLCTNRLTGADQGPHFNWEDSQQKQSFHSGSINHNSVKNPTDSAPKRDYSALPLLAAPPQIGLKIAFKLLELSENYTPEVSTYKEGKIISFDPVTKQTELELLHVPQALQPIEPGKFDLVYQNADGSETVEYAVSRGSLVTERWDSLLEPRLII